MEGRQHQLKYQVERVFDALAAHYGHVHQHAREDPGTAGDAVEETWGQVLRDRLPAGYHVVTKGRIIDHLGRSSPQVDVLVLAPEYPKAFLNTKYYFAAGVVAAFECKLTLRKRHFEALFETAGRVKTLHDWPPVTPFRFLNSPIVFGALAHAHEWSEGAKGTDQLWDVVEEAVEEYGAHPRLLPDVFCIANGGTWRLANSLLIPGHLDAEQAEEHPEGGIQTGYFHYGLNLDLKRERRGVTIGAFLSDLLERLAMRDARLRPIARYVLDAGVMGVGIGRPLMAPLELLPEELRQQIDKRGFESEFWSEWAKMF